MKLIGIIVVAFNIAFVWGWMRLQHLPCIQAAREQEDALETAVEPKENDSDDELYSVWTNTI